MPMVTAVAFTFMGIEGIAEEIEMPFGTDDCDLPLGLYPGDKYRQLHHFADLSFNRSLL